MWKMSGFFELTEYISAALLLGGALMALLCRRRDKIADLFGAASCFAALLLNLTVVFSGDPWKACFQLPILLVGFAAAWHSIGYMQKHGRNRMSLYWFLFNIMLAAMLCITRLKSGFAFLAAWEVMGLASFALVGFEWKKAKVVRASWIYLLACEAGGLLLIWLLVNMERIPFGAAAAVTMIAFGLKAGFPLLHVWLPEAHPAAPAPVSAVMSAAMIPLGFYGIVTWCPGVLGCAAVGWVMFFLGVSGMLMGILFGAAQRDLKRLLAYSSVENIGIMTMAFALSILGAVNGNVLMMVLGWSGALLHLINHALLKGSLFLAAGSVYQAVHTLNMDVMGGLNKKMPWTGTAFTVSALGISGLPPFCGCAGELLIYLASFQGIASGRGALFAACVTAVIALALTGGMAAAAFAKSISAVFAGEPRSKAAEDVAGEVENMLIPVCITALIAIVMTWAAPFVVSNIILKTLGTVAPDVERKIFEPLACNGLCSFALLVLTLLLLWCRLNFCRKGDRSGLTWDCGYAQPTARMQYTATAFVQPLADLFNGILRQKKNIVKPATLFPADSSIDVAAPDGGSRWLWSPLFQIANHISNKVRHLQSGLLHVYILIMFLAILLMLLGSFLSSSKSFQGNNGQNDSAEVVKYE